MEKEKKGIKCSYALLVVILFATVCFLTDYIFIERKTRVNNCPKCENTCTKCDVKEENSVVEESNQQTSQNESIMKDDLCAVIKEQSNPLDFGMNTFEYSSDNISKIDFNSDMQNNKVILTAYKGNDVVWKKQFDVVIGAQQDYFDPISVNGSYLYLQLNGKIVLLNLESGIIVKELSYKDEYSVVTVSNIYEDSKYIIISGHYHEGYSFSDEIVIIDKENNIIKNVISTYKNDVFYVHSGIWSENDTLYFHFVKEKDEECSEEKYELKDLTENNFSFWN